MISCLKLQIDFSPWQFILPKYFNLSAFRSVLYPPGSLNQNLSLKMTHILLQLITTTCWHSHCQEYQQGILGNENVKSP